MNPIASRSFAGHSLTFGFDSDIYLLEFRNSLISVRLGAQAAVRTTCGWILRVASIDAAANENLMQIGIARQLSNSGATLQIAQNVAHVLLRNICVRSIHAG